MDLDGGPRIQGPSHHAPRRLVAVGGNPRGHLPGPGRLGHRDAQRIHPPFEGAPNKHRPKQPPVVLVHLAGQPCHTFLVRHRRVAERRRSSI